MPPVTRSAKKAAKEPAAKSHDVKSSAPAAKKPKKSKEQNDESEGHAAPQDKSESKNKKTDKGKDQSESASMSEDKNGSTAGREQKGKDEKDKGKKDVMFGIRFTHPDKQLFPEAHVSKAELAQYYLDMEPRILPWIKQRPITLVRGVKGVKDNRQWVQKHPPKGLDSHMTVISLQEKGDKHYGKYMVAGSAMALVAACQMDTLEFHTWHSTQTDLNKPS